MRFNSDLAHLARPILVLIFLALPFGQVGPADPVVTLEQRIEAQRALEQVRWTHRLWPAQNVSGKPDFADVVPEDALRTQVADYLGLSRVLEQRWGRAVTAEQLQDELDRMARDTKDPRRLRELFAALDDDPLRVAECLARPVLVQRLARELHAADRRIHGPQETALREALRAVRSPEQLERLGGRAVELAVKPESDEPRVSSSTIDAAIETRVGAAEWQRLRALTPRDVSPLVEKRDRFEVEVVLDRSQSEIRLLRLVWPKQSFDTWWQEYGRRDSDLSWSDRLARRSHAYVLPSTEGVGCTDDTWAPTSVGTDVPDARERHTAVWTGAEMIVWGGRGPDPLDSGGRYDPVTDSWTPTTTFGAPTPRFDHTAVWTGTAMIVWGGFGGEFENTGASYNPAANSWAATGTVDVPDARFRHLAVWTGTEMIVWGGYDQSYLASGGRYEPTMQSWTPTSEGADVPDGRTDHTVVWSGDEMIVWGGYDGLGDVQSGGRYDPVGDGWTETNELGECPSARESHSAVWTGDEMIVWGGVGLGILNSGGRYDPLTDGWLATPTTGAPSNRRWHTAVWAETEMIVWGGIGGGTSGGRFNPLSDAWTATSVAAGVPDARRHHTAVWTGPGGSLMIVWGGFTTTYANSGGVYCATCTELAWFADTDGDGFGDPGDMLMACEQPPGYLLDGTDCDDSLNTVYPGAPQVCDGLNNDCDDPSWPGLLGTNEFDNDGDTFTTCAGDCDDTDVDVWMVPGETRDVLFDTGESLTWLEPAAPGGNLPLYDTIRADMPTTFDSAGFCVLSDDPNTSSSDTDRPDPTAVFFYLIRAENSCGAGGVGAGSDGMPRSATSCP